MTKVKKSAKLPNKIIPLPNADKEFHEHWYKNRNLLNFPHPYRSVILGKPNVGKTTLIKNIIMRQHPPFEEIKVIHCDGNYTQEYNDLECEMLDSIPEPEEWEGQVKTFVILDDLEYKLMNKEQKRSLDRLFGYVSTHKNISVMLTAQDPFNVPPIVRRCSNLFVLWKSNDMDSLSQLSRKSGLKSDELKDIFKHVCNQPRDSLWIDLTSGTPAPLRKNGFEILEKNEPE